MSFRRKLLALFALTVCLSVGVVAWIVSATARRAFERVNEETTASLVAQFQREFHRRGEEIVRRVAAIAAGEQATRMALAENRGPSDSGSYVPANYVNEAKSLAEGQQLDFLEFLESDGTVVSSAQWPAKVGYKENSVSPSAADAFLRQEELPEGAALCLCAARAINLGEKPLYVIGGEKLDRNFLASLELPAGTRALFYQNLVYANQGAGFSPQLLIDPAGGRSPAPLAPLIEQVQQQARQTSAIVHWSAEPAEDETVTAIPLTGANSQLLGILLVASSRRSYVELRQHIRTGALLAAGTGILLAIVFSGWAAARVTRPVEQLAQTARDVAAGNWNARVAVSSSDELGDLAEAFNRMTGELLEQRDRLLQSERVAAWRELARRLAHELKNPLFPLQLTVENLVRARQQSPQLFEEIFPESSSTLLAELANLKNIIARFGEFSKMPQPQFQEVQVNELLQNVAQLFQAQMQSGEHGKIECRTEFEGSLPAIAADPELLHRAFSNLVLNAMDAMPQGGTLTLRTSRREGGVRVEISDTGAGLTAEECQRLFTPYYTSKAHGTGLGLAIVQSVISDHGGKISVRSQPGRGASFIIELPENREKLQRASESTGTA